MIPPSWFNTEASGRSPPRSGRPPGHQAWQLAGVAHSIMRMSAQNWAFVSIVWAVVNDQVWVRRDQSEHAARYGNRFCQPRDRPLRHPLHSYCHQVIDFTYWHQSSYIYYHATTSATMTATSSLPVVPVVSRSKYSYTDSYS